MRKTKSLLRLCATQPTCFRERWMLQLRNREPPLKLRQIWIPQRPVWGFAELHKLLVRMIPFKSSANSANQQRAPRLQSVRREPNRLWFSSVAKLDVPSVLLKHLHGHRSRSLKLPHCSCMNVAR